MKKLTISLLIISLFNYLACTTLNVASKESVKKEMKNDTLSGEIYIITLDNNRYHFGEWGYQIKNDTLYGNGLKINPNGEEPFKGKIALDDISHFEVQELDVLETTRLSVFIAGSIVSIIWIGSSFKWGKWK